jgi:hypothetical protein
MKYSIVVATLFVCLVQGRSAGAQSAEAPKTVRRSLSRELYEVYQVSPQNKKVKDGTYEVVNETKEVLVKGQYKEGKKSGIWEYYSNGVVVQRFDFDKDQIVFEQNDPNSMVSSTYSVNAITDDKDTVVPPAKIGGANYGFFLLYDPRSIPADVKATSSNLSMTYVFTISDQGKLLDWTVMYKGDSVAESREKEDIHRLPEDAYEFTAASVNGKPVQSKLVYRVPLNVDHTTLVGAGNGVATKHQGVN